MGGDKWEQKDGATEIDLMETAVRAVAPELVKKEHRRKTNKGSGKLLFEIITILIVLLFWFLGK